MRIAIVNDLPMAVEAMRRVLAQDPKHQVAWVAFDGREAVASCARDKPDLILMDLIMPGMDGLEATRRIMAETPCPILIVTATVDGNSAKVFEALGYGAMDAINTPSLPAAGETPPALLAKINLLSKLIMVPDGKAGEGTKDFSTTLWTRRSPLVAIGASAGGPAAVATVLRALPPNFPAALILIQHVDEQFAAGLADWLQQVCGLPVRLAREGDRPVTGTVLVAGTADHLAFCGPEALGYTAHPREYVYRPSVDVFFESVVRHWRGDATGVLLTGMGRDGAKGLKAMRDAGWPTLAQDQATSAVYGMPKAAAALNAASQILPLDAIGPAVIKIVSDRKSPIRAPQL